MFVKDMFHFIWVIGTMDTETYNHETMEGQRMVLIFRVRRARQKAMKAAIAEALALLADFNPSVLSGGPLGHQPGLFWIELQDSVLPAALDRIPLLGYTFAVDMVKFSEGRSRGRSRRTAIQQKWHGRPFDLQPLHREDSDEFRNQAPDRRSFVLHDKDGSLKEIRGYRGDGGQLSRRGLPVADARLLVNLAFVCLGGKLLDPFAGAGGVVVAALCLQQDVFSVDIDQEVKWGLQHQGSRHCIGDARQLPFRDCVFDSVASEAPFEAASKLVGDAMTEVARVLRPSGHAAMMVAEHQADVARERAREAGLVATLDTPIDRKGLCVFVLAWNK